MSHSLPSLLVLGLFLTVSPLAHADVPPPDSCTTVGATCDTAGPGYDEPGTCVTSTCQRATPDGPMQYECKRCVTSAGAGGGPSTGDGGATPSPSKSDDDDGCAVGRGHPTAPTLLVVAALGLLALRRKRHA